MALWPGTASGTVIQNIRIMARISDFSLQHVVTHPCTNLNGWMINVTSHSFTWTEWHIHAPNLMLFDIFPPDASKIAHKNSCSDRDDEPLLDIHRWRIRSDCPPMLWLGVSEKSSITLYVKQYIHKHVLQNVMCILPPPTTRTDHKRINLKLVVASWSHMAP